MSKINPSGRIVDASALSRRLVRRLWDEGVASGVPKRQMTMDEIKQAGRRRRAREA